MRVTVLTPLLFLLRWTLRLIVNFNFLTQFDTKHRHCHMSSPWSAFIDGVANQTSPSIATGSIRPKPNSCIVEGVGFFKIECWPQALDSTWFQLIDVGSTWLALVPLDDTWSHFSFVNWMITVYSKFMAFDCQRFSHKVFIFLTFSHFFHFLIIFYHDKYLNIFNHLSGYHLCIQNPSKTNPSKSGYQHRCPDFDWNLEFWVLSFRADPFCDGSHFAICCAK